MYRKVKASGKKEGGGRRGKGGGGAEGRGSGRKGGGGEGRRGRGRGGARERSNWRREGGSSGGGCCAVPLAASIVSIGAIAPPAFPTEGTMRPRLAAEKYDKSR
jgi:hypothetical protein